MKNTEMLKHGSNRFEKKVDVSRDTSKSSKEVAKEAGVSKKTVDRTKKAMELEPGKVDEIIEGKVTPTEIINEHKAKAEQDIAVTAFAEMVEKK